MPAEIPLLLQQRLENQRKNLALRQLQLVRPDLQTLQAMIIWVLPVWIDTNVHSIFSWKHRQQVTVW
jgi:hypothetical protein